jgi:hypothetical protein
MAVRLTTSPTELPMLGEPKPRAFDILFPLLLGGYLLFDKAFAYLHIPGTQLFIGEIVLAFGLVGAVRVLKWPSLWRVTDVAYVMVAYAAWGLIMSIQGVFDDPIVALRDATIWGYELVALAVVGAFAFRPATLSRWLTWYRRAMPYVVAWLPISVILGSLDIGTVPDTTVPLTSFSPGKAAVQLLMIIAFLWLVTTPRTSRDQRWRVVMTGASLVGILVAATGNRGGFVAALMGLVVFLVLYPARSRLIVTFIGVVLVTVVATVVIDPRIELGEREVSARQLTENVASIVTGEGEGGLGGNISWRLRHWSEIWEGVNEDHPLTGHGFGPNVAEIYHVPQTDLGLRNAHNSHLTILARSGWIGLGLWVLLWGLWYVEVNRARRRLQSAGLDALSGVAAWAMIGTAAMHVEAVFNPSIEGPQTAFWFWTVFAFGLFVSIVTHKGTRMARGSGRGVAATYDLDGLEQSLRGL